MMMLAIEQVSRIAEKMAGCSTLNWQQIFLPSIIAASAIFLIVIGFFMYACHDIWRDLNPKQNAVKDFDKMKEHEK